MPKGIGSTKIYNKSIHVSRVVANVIFSGLSPNLLYPLIRISYFVHDSRPSIEAELLTVNIFVQFVDWQSLVVAVWIHLYAIL